MAIKHGLGRGLGALIKDSPSPATPARTPAAPEADTPPVLRIPVGNIRKSTLQPRQKFDENAMSELIASIREQGVLQPLLVRRAGAAYELIAGERRLKASIEAGLKEVPVIVMEASDNQALLMALVENLQREDLNVLEEAEGYRALTARFGLTQEQIAQRVGKARPSVANTLRVLDLPKEVRDMLADGRLSAGHAKALIGVEIPQELILLAHRAVKESLSVRRLEKLVQKIRQAPRKPRASRSEMPADHLSYISDKLHQHFGTAVRILPSRTYANGKKRKGTVEIDFYSNDDLDRLLQIMGIEL